MIITPNIHAVVNALTLSLPGNPSEIKANKRTPTKTKDNLICETSWKKEAISPREHGKKAHNTMSAPRLFIFRYYVREARR